ncbi:MAG: carbon starvation CstA family protein [Clostridia bacterium]
MAKDTSSKIIAKESHSPLVGYGGMLMEKMVAIMALVIGMTIIIKMGKAKYTWVTLLPMARRSSATLYAGWLKMFSPNLKIVFWAHAQASAAKPGAIPLLLKRGEPRGEEALALLSFHHSLRSQRRKGKC